MEVTEREIVIVIGVLVLLAVWVFYELRQNRLWKQRHEAEKAWASASAELQRENNKLLKLVLDASTKALACAAHAADDAAAVLAALENGLTAERKIEEEFIEEASALKPVEQPEVLLGFGHDSEAIECALAELGKRIRLARLEVGISVPDLEVDANLPTGCLAEIEAGHRFISRGALRRIAKALGVLPETLTGVPETLTGEPEEPNSEPEGEDEKE